MKYDTVLFDLGSTLIMYENKFSWRELACLGCRRAGAMLNDTLGIELSARELAARLLKTLDEMLEAERENLAEIDIFMLVRDVLEHFGVSASDGLPAKFIDEYYKPTTEQILLEKDAPEILAGIKSAKMTLGLVSNSIFPAEFHRAEMRRFGIFDYFDFTIFSSEIGIRKPKREIYQKALALAGGKPEKTVFIGDREPEDITGPQRMGIAAILKFDKRREYSPGMKPLAVIHNLGELEKLLL